jgi:hypothetical protein
MNDIVGTNSNQKNRAEHWSSHIKRWDESNLSQPEYCKQAGIAYTSFVYWRCKLTAESKASPTNFVPIAVAKKSSVNAEPPKSISDIATLINAIGNVNA